MTGNGSLSDSQSTVPSTNTRVIHKNRSLPMVKPTRNFYMWLGGLMHAKRLFVLVQLVMCVVALLGLSAASGDDSNCESMMHMFDAGLSRGMFSRPSPADDLMRDVSSTNESSIDLCELARTVVNGACYFYLISVCLAVYGLRRVEHMWTGRRAGMMFNPALLLLPSLIALVSLLLPLLFWSVRTGRRQSIIFRQTDDKHTVWYKVLCSIKNTYLPLFIIWAVVLYVLYGATLAFCYAWRRAADAAKRRALPFGNWSVKERVSRLELGLNKSGYSSRSWKSTKNPSLRGYTHRADDSMASLLSLEGSGSADTSGSEGARTYASVDPWRKGYSFSDRRLEPVQEERESQAGSASARSDERF